MNVSDQRDDGSSPGSDVPPGVTGDETAALRADLTAAKAQAEEYLDGWQRERAAFANYRRRTEQERATIGQDAVGDVICQLLPVVDDLTRACANVPADLSGHAWVDGVCMVLRKLEQSLQQLGIEPIQAEGAQFDPRCHEALTHEAMPGCAEGQVIGEVGRGYRMGDRVLRCSLVRVAKSGSDNR